MNNDNSRRLISPSRAILLLLLIEAASIRTGGQTARQGDADQLRDQTEYVSPMILETVFAAANPSYWKSGRWFAIDDYHELGKFSCDGVNLRRWYLRGQGTWQPGLEMLVREITDKHLEVRTRVTVYNPKNNHDRMITLLLDVLNGEDLVAHSRIGPMECEEGDQASEEVRFFVRRDALRSEPITALRVTMTTEKY